MVNRIRSVSRVRFIYVVTTLFLVGLSVFSFYKINKLFNSSNLIVFHTQVKDSFHNIVDRFLEAESNIRGYLLTGDAVLLERRDAALSAIGQEEAHLATLVTSYPELNEPLEHLHPILIDAIRACRSVTKEDTSPGSHQRQQEKVLAQDKALKIAITYTNTLIERETQFIEQRSRMFTRLSLIAPMYLIVLFLGALLILSYSYNRISTELHQSHKLHAELLKQGEDRETLAAELIQANKELAYQNEEKEMRASELAIANLELGFQNETKAKLADELIVANQELAYQNEEKEKRAAELFKANKELQLFLNISSHDLQEPLRKIQMSASRISTEDFDGMTAKGRDHFIKMQEAAHSMQTLIEDLLTYSRTNTEERKFETIDIVALMEDVRDELKEAIEEKQALLQLPESGYFANVIPFQFRQLLHNIITNALKFSKAGISPEIRINCNEVLGGHTSLSSLQPDKAYHHIVIADNGIGFDPVYGEKIFEVFQRLYGKETYKGTGIGLAIVKRIVENHHGVITATSQLQKGACFDIYIPVINAAQNG